MNNILEARKALTQKPIFATSAERFLILDEIKSQYKELPQPIRFAKYMEILLSRVSCPLEPYDLIAGRCVDRELSEQEEIRFQEFVHHPDHPKRAVMFSSGHCTYDWDALAEEGLVGLKLKASNRLIDEKDEEKRIFLTAIILIYDAISAYMLRYARKAREIGNEDLAIVLEQGATEKPRSFRCALQLLWIVTMINCAYISENPTLTVGRLDQLLLPLYQKDIQSGILNKSKAEKLIIDYYCKHNLIMGRGEHQVGDDYNSTTFKRICNFDAPQYLLLAGTDRNGNPAVNELTEIFVHCIQPEFKNPVVVVRYFKNLNTMYPQLWHELMEKALQSASLMYYNDDNVLNTLRRMGVPEEDAAEYAHFGCNWLSLGTKSAWLQSLPGASDYGNASEEDKKVLRHLPVRMYGKYGWPELLMKVLNNFKDLEECSIDDVYQLFFDELERFLDHKFKVFALETKLRQSAKSARLSFTDCFTVHSIEKAQCFTGGAKYHFALMSFYMFATTADSFITVDKLVFKDRAITIKRLLEAVEHDFEGYPDVLAMCRNIEKYGSDSALSNYHAKKLATAFSDMVIEKNRPYFEKYGLLMTPCMQSDTWHFKCGRLFGATPDGRRAYTPFSQNIRPSNGAAIHGLSAMLNSVANLPNDGFLSGALNLDVSAKEFQGEHGIDLFGALLGTYFNQGGLHAQVSATEAEQLLDAQVHPDEHRDIRVRVTGYSGIFVDISKELQKDIIERFK